MKYALVNPRWCFSGSIFFGCREPHLPLELGYARQLLEAAGHDVLLLDASLLDLTPCQVQSRIAAFAPDLTVVPTAPSYLFWRCPPPELSVPRDLLALLGESAGTAILVGPHPSTTPGVALRKTGAHLAVMGECEETLVALGERPLRDVPGVAYWQSGELVRQGGSQTVNLPELPALRWPDDLISAHVHHHHRFDTPQHGLGAELEASRGCPYSCSFCAKGDHRDRFRRRSLDTVLDELDHLIDQGVRYVYFVDEILLPQEELLTALRARPVAFGIQTRIDLWRPAQLDQLAEAGCVSIEAGVESITDAGRHALNKQCRLTTEELHARLLRARQGVPFVQASLLATAADDGGEVEHWRQRLEADGIWANPPVPMFPYPGSMEYFRRWGLPDESAWERAVSHYLSLFSEFSDVQDARPEPLEQLEQRGTGQ